MKTHRLFGLCGFFISALLFQCALEGLFAEAAYAAENKSVAPEVHSAINRLDPWEKVNRKIFAFNEATDRYFIKPIAQFYRFILPSGIDLAVTRMFSNLQEPVVIINDALQGKFDQSLLDFSRFTFNSTFGLLGIFDVATHFGLSKHEEDFGQTLGVWGINQGPYLVLPFLGPSTARNSFGVVPDQALTICSHAHKIRVRRGLGALNLVDLRADFLIVEGVISGDRYSFVRDAYLQSQNFQLQDGKTQGDPFLEEF